MQAPVPVPAPEPVPVAPLVVAVELHLPDGTDREGLSDMVSVRKGQVLSARAVRRSVERLWASDRFSDIVVRSVDVPGGVRVVFELTPVQPLVRIEFLGNTVLRAQALRDVLKAEHVVEGQRLEEESVGAALKALHRAYGRQGYNGVHIELARQQAPGGVALVFTFTEGRPTTVAAVSVTGSPGLALSELLATLGLRVGGVLDRGGPDAGLERLRALLRERGYWRASVGQPLLEEEEGAATVVVPLSAGPRFHLHFRGNHHFPDSLLARVLAYDGAEPLDSATVARLARRLETFYRYRGFHEVHVEPRELVHPRGEEAVLAFDIEEGRVLRVSRVNFQGNSALSDEALREILTEHVRASTPQPATPSRPRDVVEMGPGAQRLGPQEWLADPALVFVEEAYQEAAEAMTEAYRERGFLEAQVRFVRERESRGWAEAWFEVSEGAQLRVASVRVEGGPPGFDGQGLLRIKPGDALNPDSVDAIRREFVTELGRRGYLFARVEAQPTPGEGGVALLFHLEPGPQVKIGRAHV